MKIRNSVKAFYFLTAAAVLLVSFCFTGCESREERLARESAEQSAAQSESLRLEEEKRLAEESERLAREEAEKAAVKEKIADILNYTPAIQGWALSYGSAIANTFHYYDWDIEEYSGGADCYIATFTGSYSPNPRDIPNLSQNGSLSLLVDLSSGAVSVYSDPNGISDAFILLALG